MVTIDKVYGSNLQNIAQNCLSFQGSNYSSCIPNDNDSSKSVMRSSSLGIHLYHISFKSINKVLKRHSNLSVIWETYIITTLQLVEGFISFLKDKSMSKMKETELHTWENGCNARFKQLLLNLIFIPKTVLSPSSESWIF